MAAASTASPGTGRPEPKSLSNELADALPSHFNCRTRYIHSAVKQCDPLFSAMPGQEAEKTRLASHFLTVSVDAASLPQRQPGDVISFAIEVLVFTTKRLATIFVSKVDSTSYVPRIRPSPIKTVVTTFLKWLSDKEQRKSPSRRIVISLFARAQAQYLFPGSSDDKGKHVLDDRQLIKWWARVLDPIISSGRMEQLQRNEADRYQGYLTVPGYAKTELKSFMPPSSGSDSQPRWIPGNPLPELAHSRGLPEHAPPRCLLPRFPDDPKARFIMDLDDEIGIHQDAQVTVSPSKRKSGRWKSVVDLEQFWEQMEFRQECSSGRAVGFLWLVITPKATYDPDVDEDSCSGAVLDSQESALPSSDPVSSQPHSQQPVARGTPKKRKRKPLSGPIIPRLPKIKSTMSGLSDMAAQLDSQPGNGILVSKEGYDKAMSVMLHLDFSTLDIATKSCTKWVNEVQGLAGLNGDFAFDVSGTMEAPVPETSANQATGANDLGGLVRKKRKVDTGAAVGPEQPVVNSLGAGLVRKKSKPAS